MSRTVSRILTDDHLACDALYAAAESAVRTADWAAAASGLQRFAAALNRHFELEEAVLFRAVERALPEATGPTRVMCMEHEQLRGVLALLERSVAACDADAFEEHAESFVILGQQHNMKEEHILYPMCDEALEEDVDVVGYVESCLSTSDAAPAGLVAV